MANSENLASERSAVRSNTWLVSDCVKAEASGAAVASQRRQGCDDSSQVRLMRVWDMPHKHTFRIATVKCLLRRFVGNGTGWADPFANDRSPAEHTNDINPDTSAKSHMDAVEFLRGFGDDALDGVLLDPPYSMHQCTVSYKGHGHARVNSLTPVYDEAARIVKCGGHVLSFGWNSNGIGAGRGFSLLEVVMIPHGGHHNDTLVAVEVKNQVADMLPTLAACARGSRNTTEQETNVAGKPPLEK